MLKFVRALDDPPHPRADLSSLMVLRTISWSHKEAQKSHGKHIYKLMMQINVYIINPVAMRFQI